MNPPARYVNELETDDLISRVCAYRKLEGQCLRALEERGANVKDIYDSARASFDEGRNPAGHDQDEETAAMDWLRFIVAESFTPKFDDPDEELERIQRYLVAASLLATESGAFPDDEP